MRSSSALLIALIASLLVGCAASGLSSGSTFRETIGTTTARTVRSQVPDILAGQYGYRFDRQSTQTEYIRYLTSWQQHSVLQEERKRGYTAVRTRIEIIAQPRDRASDTYTADMRLEYMVQQEGGTAGWTTAEDIPASRQDYIDDIYDELSSELTQGVLAQ